MGQFMGWQSYDLITVCGHCGEEGPREDMRDHYCTAQDNDDEFDEEEFVEQSQKTIEEMSDDE